MSRQLEIQQNLTWLRSAANARSSQPQRSPQLRSRKANRRCAAPAAWLLPTTGSCVHQIMTRICAQCDRTIFVCSRPDLLGRRGTALGRRAIRQAAFAQPDCAIDSAVWTLFSQVALFMLPLTETSSNADAGTVERGSRWPFSVAVFLPTLPVWGAVCPALRPLTTKRSACSLQSACQR